MNHVGWYDGPHNRLKTWSWNPFAMRCSNLACECRAGCWHLRACDRLAGMAQFTAAERAVWEGYGPPLLRKGELDAPLRKRKPALIATQYMGDICDPALDDRRCAVDEIVKVIADSAQHQFLMLSKRPDRYEAMLYHVNECCQERYLDPDATLPNLWLGASACDQPNLDRRLPHLLAVPAAHRWLSLEPLLWPMGLHLAGTLPQAEYPGRQSVSSRIDWVIVGCESGAGRKPCLTGWISMIIEQCRDASVPCYVKQVDLGGRVSRDPADWPAYLRVRQTPWDNGETP